MQPFYPIAIYVRYAFRDNFLVEEIIFSCLSFCQDFYSVSNICGKTYQTEAVLRTHIETVHVKSQVYKCPKCDVQQKLSEKTFKCVVTPKQRVKNHTNVTSVTSVLLHQT